MIVKTPFSVSLLRRGYSSLLQKHLANLGPITGLSAAQVSDTMAKQKETVIIDVREPIELEKEGYIPGALNIPRSKLEFQIEQAIQGNLETPVILYCAAGVRSALGVDVLKRMGLKKVAHLEGGFKEWKSYRA